MHVKELIRKLQEEVDRRARTGIDDDPSVDLAVEQPGHQRVTYIGVCRTVSVVGNEIRITGRP